MNFVQNAVYLFLTVFTVSLLFIVQIISSDDSLEPVVEINLGKIRGRILKSDYGADFNAFRGIPYAKPPVDDLRFKVPQPVDKWEGTLDATEDGHMCIQSDFDSQFMGDEDCLNLNVYSPKLDASLPVLFFIHGGGFFCGSGASSLYGAQRFMDREVVLVTINYRLGAFGFLSTGDEVSPGNYGMHDQVLALQWVRDNIQDFGGDPNRVTIFGESAGGASVGLHMLSPLSKGLFHGAIQQSGSALCDWSTMRLHTAQKLAKELAESLDCPTDCSKKLVDCLRKRAALDIIVKAALAGQTNVKQGRSAMMYFPVVDKSINEENAFLPDKPITFLTENKVNAVPTLIGVTRDEGVLLLSLMSKAFNGLREIRKEHIPKLLAMFIPHHFENKEIARRAIAAANVYLQNVDESDLIERITTIGSFLDDPAMEYPADETIVHLAKHKVPTYAYKLTHIGKYSAVDKLASDPAFSNKDWKFVTHLDDMQYLFSCGYFLSTDLRDEDRKMADIMLTLWTNFAKTKVPSLDGSTGDYPKFEWLPSTTDNFVYLNLSLNPEMVHGHLCNTYDLWREISGAVNYKDEL